MSSYQKLIVVGNLGRDVELKYLQDGTPVADFSLATNRRWGDGNEETTWFRVSVFGKQAETCKQYLSKGRQVLVEGRLRPDDHGNPRVWQDKEGNHRSSYEMRARVVQFLGRGQSQGQEEDTEVPF